MFLEVKVKVTWIIDSKPKKRVETYLLEKEVMAQAEYAIMNILNTKQQEGSISEYEIQSIKLSPIKEINLQYQGEHSYIASMKDIFIQDDGTERALRYKIILWASNISDAMSHVREIAQQGYDMQIESLKEVDYYYIDDNGDTESNQSEEAG